MLFQEAVGPGGRTPGEGSGALEHSSHMFRLCMHKYNLFVFVYKHNIYAHVATLSSVPEPLPWEQTASCSC